MFKSNPSCLAMAYLFGLHIFGLFGYLWGYRVCHLFMNHITYLYIFKIPGDQTFSFGGLESLVGKGKQAEAQPAKERNTGVEGSDMMTSQMSL